MGAVRRRDREELAARGGCSDALYEDMVFLLHVLPMDRPRHLGRRRASCPRVAAEPRRLRRPLGRGGLTFHLSPWQRSSRHAATSSSRGARRRHPAATTAPLSVAVVGQEDAVDADAVVLAVGARPLRDSRRRRRRSATCRRARWSSCVVSPASLSPISQARGAHGGGAGRRSHVLPPSVAQAMAASPVAVVGPKVLPELKETGFCIYDLQRMHDEFASGDVAVLELDFYRADQIAEIEDDAEVVSLALRAATAALKLPASALDASAVVDSAVVRARRAVSHFAPGSAALSPPVRLGGGVYAAGDWIDRAGHASWSTEKAVVTGRQAAGAIGRDLGLTAVDSAVIPAAEDTAQLQALRGVAKAVRGGAGGPRAAAAGAVGRTALAPLRPVGIDARRRRVAAAAGLVPQPRRRRVI